MDVTGMWSQHDLYLVGQHGVLYEVKRWKLTLFEWNWISWFTEMSVLYCLTKKVMPQ